MNEVRTEAGPLTAEEEAALRLYAESFGPPIWPAPHVADAWAYDVQRLLATLDRDRAEARASAFAQVEEAVSRDIRPLIVGTKYEVLAGEAVVRAVLAAIADLRTKGGTE